MFFDADFPMGQVAHFMAWFVEELKMKGAERHQHSTL